MNILELLLLSGEYIENKEGVVITFENGKMAKQKHKHYLLLHGILSDGLKENKLVAKILNDEIDDVLSLLPVDAFEERDFIDQLSGVIISYVNHLVWEIMDTFKKNMVGDKTDPANRKEFAVCFKNHPLFFFMTKLFNDNEDDFECIEKMVIKNIIFKCRKLELARTFLKERGFERKLKLLSEEDN